MSEEGVQYCALVMQFVGEVEDPASFGFIEGGDLCGEQMEGGLGQAEELVRGDSEELSGIEAACDGGEGMMGCARGSEQLPLIRLTADVLEGDRGVGQAESEELHDGAANAVVWCERRIVFQHVHHACPAGESEQFCGEECVPVVFVHAQPIEHLEDDFGWVEAEAGLSLELVFHPVEVIGEHRGGAAHDVSRALEKAFFTVWHWPIGDALIQVSAGQADEWGVNNVIEVDAETAGHGLRGATGRLAFWCVILRV
jgi:hypothetical protein